MSTIAINVLLDPDPATVEKARAVNARLRENFPHGFALDENHAPHLTILQRFVRTSDVEAVANAVVAVLREGPPVRWESRGDRLLRPRPREPRAGGHRRRADRRTCVRVAAEDQSTRSRPFAVDGARGEAFAPRPRRRRRSGRRRSTT